MRTLSKEFFRWLLITNSRSWFTETRVGGDRAARIIEDLLFDRSIVTDTIDYAGGLWLLWKKDDVDVVLLSSTEYEMHATVRVRTFDPI